MRKGGKIFAWDFHGTLEQGTEVGFWHILKQIAKKRGRGFPFRKTAADHKIYDFAEILREIYVR